MNNTTVETKNKEVEVTNPQMTDQTCSTKEPDQAQPQAQTENVTSYIKPAEQARKEKDRDDWIRAHQYARINNSNMSSAEKEKARAEIDERLKRLRAANADGKGAQTWRDLEVGCKLKQNAKIELITPGTLVVGVDIGKDTHNMRAFNKEGKEIVEKAVMTFRNREENLETAVTWIENIMVEHGFDRVILGLEPTGIYWIDSALYFVENGITVVTVNQWRQPNVS